MCICVIETMKAIYEEEKKDKIDPVLGLSQRRDNIFRIEISGCENELKRELLNIIQELFQDLSLQHYVITVTCQKPGQGLISKLFADGEKHLIPFGVPDKFNHKEELTIFLKLWRRLVSNDEMMGFRLPDSKKKVKTMLKQSQIPMRPQTRICKLLV